MTEYWVSQGNKWCDTCKIYISNNPASIRNHELGQKHKDNVATRLNTMREAKAAKDKELKQSARLLEQIEAKAKRSYQKDLATFREARESNAEALIAEGNDQGVGDNWEYEASSGYYYNQKTNCYYDPNSSFYYTDALGKWVTQEEALAATQVSSGSIPKKPSLGKPPSSSASASETKNASTSESGPPPGRVVSTPLNPMRPIKEEVAALKAREAAKKREVCSDKIYAKHKETLIGANQMARRRFKLYTKQLTHLVRSNP
ncbi:hypothetical protein BUALT_Bualt15G0034300 [Buddleja alternifolia]|uniref:Matrin-type domain-containing protein n=1 Tax=Buddleja alternifolia TaxID=168488 RepID=A0AAV6WKE2_9LAMI|nr:hypothetical protein BUALT_Bualt15G0034300 [Buddleja alternifolia]